MKKKTDKQKGMSRRKFLREPVLLGGSAIALSALGGQTLAQQGGQGPAAFEPHFDDDQSYRVRSGLGIVIVGASSGLGAELARQYAAHGAYVVLAARRTERLQQVAAEVSARGGVPHVITTDVRDEAQCKALIEQSIAWLATQGKVIDILAIGPLRAQSGAIRPERSTEVWRTEIDTHYFGAVLCLKYAVPHLKQNRSTVFYFNSIAASIVLLSGVGYSSMKHAWHGVMQVLKSENPELNVVSSYFNAIDTEAWDKGLTLFNDGKRYCPSPVRTYFIPTENMYSVTTGVEKVLRAIETKTPSTFLSVLNKAAWLIGFTRVELGGFLAMLENAMPAPYKLQLEADIKRSLKGAAANGYIAQLLRKLDQTGTPNELVDAARYVRSMDQTVALYLLALDEQIDKAVYAAAQQGYAKWLQSYADGSWQQFELAMSSGALSPSGITDDNDGFAPITQCPKAG